MTGELKRKTGHTDLPRARGGARDHFCFACQSSSKAPSLSPLKFLLVMPTSGQQPRVALQSLASQPLSLSLSLSLSVLLLAVLARAQPVKGRKRETCVGLISPCPFTPLVSSRGDREHACCHFQQDISPRLEPSNPRDGVAQWSERQTSHLKVVGSNPSIVVAF